MSTLDTDTRAIRATHSQPPEEDAERDVLYALVEDANGAKDCPAWLAPAAAHGLTVEVVSAADARPRGGFDGRSLFETLCAASKGTADCISTSDSPGGFYRAGAGAASAPCGCAVLWGRMLPSTQRILADALPLAPLGAVCVATQQSKGAGRAGNAWVSPLGCLCASFTVAVRDPQHLITIQYVAALAVVRGAADCATPAEWNARPLRLKWPNDVYAGPDKVAGILCNSRYDPARALFVSTVGVGLNTSNALPTTCLDALYPSTAPHARELVLSRIMAQFGHFMEMLEREGFGASLRSAYTAHWMHGGQRLTLAPDGTAVTVVGLSPEGQLLGTTDSGETVELHPDGNSLDIFKGLIKKKIAPPPQ